MQGRTAGALVVAAVLFGCTACTATVAGTPTWPGAILSQAMLTETDFPAGVQYGRILEQPGDRDGAGEPGSMLSRPEGCANALTAVIKQTAEASGTMGPGSAVKYAVSYDGARIVVTLLSWNLELDALEAAADRCASFEAFFDPASEGIPMTTAALPGLSDETLAYQQTMTLGNSASSVYMAFQNVRERGLFAIAYPTPNPTIEAKASLPQTFLDVFSSQVKKLQAS